MVQQLQAAPPAASREGKWKEVALEAAKLIGTAAWKIVSRTIAWGAAGLAASILVYVALALLGWLDCSSPYSLWIRWGLLPVYLLAGAGLLGYAGFLRGIGRTLLHVGIERGLVSAIVERLLDKVVERLRRADTIRSAMDRGDRVLRNLPLQTAEDALKGAVSEYLTSDDLEAELHGVRRRIARAVKRALVVRIEKYLLSRVRAERTAAGGGGVDVEKLIELAPNEAQKAVGGMIEGFMGKQLLLMSALAFVAFALPPGVLAFLR